MPNAIARIALTLSAALLLAACGSGSSDPTGTGAPADTAPSEGTEPRAGLGCSWMAVSDIETTNVAFPDAGARYWLALVPNIPGTRLRIDGRYPDARYFSFNVYDPLLRPIDAIADVEIAPDEAGRNPFRTPDAEPGAGYTAFVEFSGRPEQPASNSIYSGEADLGPGLPNPLTGMLYRTYVPADFADFKGGVGLPQLALETTDGSNELLPLGDCEEAPLPNAFGLFPGVPLNELVVGADYPEAVDQALGLNLPLATHPPSTRVFYGLPDTALAILGNLLPAELPLADALPEQTAGGGGFLSNVHNAYTSTGFDRAFGDIYLLRARAPTFPGDARAAASGARPDLRYWSVCQNEFATQRFVDCVIDRDAPLDDAGFFTVAVSDAADRPVNAVADADIAWLPWGGIYKDGILIYRHMLPADDFAEAIHNVPRGTDPEAVMGDYFPQATYCSRETFEAAGGDAAEIFAACAAEQAEREPGGLLGPVLNATGAAGR